MRSFLIILSLCLVAFSHSQDAQQDSLLAIWNNGSAPSDVRIKAYKDYINDKYMFTKPDSAYLLAQSLYKFSKSKNYEKGLSMALNIMGESMRKQSAYSESLKYYNEALTILEKLGDNKGVAANYGNIAAVYQRQGVSLKAIDYLKKALKIFNREKDDYGVAVSNINLGVMYFDIGDFQKSLDYNLNALNLFQKFENPQALGTVYHNLGSAYNGLGQYEEAMDMYGKSIEISSKYDMAFLRAMTLSNIGDSYCQQDRRQEGIPFFKQSLELKKEIGDTKGTALTITNLGTVNGELGNYKRAIDYCSESYEIAQEINDFTELEAACECLYKNHKKLRNGDKALFYHEKMLAIRDSLQKEETGKKLQRIEFEKQVLADSLAQVEKDLKIEMAHREELRVKDRNRNMAIAGGVFFLLLSGGLYGRWRHVRKTKAIVEKEKYRSENLLLNILPSEIAEELKAKGSADARDFDMVSILFTDFKGFTQVSETLSAKELISEINSCFKAFDNICETYGIEKIKTIGDSYMAAGGLPIPSDSAAKNTVLAALEMQAFVTNRLKEKQAKGEVAFQMRVGIHTGPVVAGIVGVKKFQYDIWGDTVNTASRMESSSEVGQVNISEATYNVLKSDSQFVFTPRGKVDAKGKGSMPMYFVKTKP